MSIFSNIYRVDPPQKIACLTYVPSVTAVKPNKSFLCVLSIQRFPGPRSWVQGGLLLRGKGEMGRGKGSKQKGKGRD